MAKKRILQQNSTHKAVLNSEKNRIEIWIKGFDCEELHYEDEYLYSIPKENRDDLLAIFDNLDETNRIYVAEFREEVKSYNFKS